MLVLSFIPTAFFHSCCCQSIPVSLVNPFQVPVVILSSVLAAMTWDFRICAPLMSSGATDVRAASVEHEGPCPFVTLPLHERYWFNPCDGRPVRNVIVHWKCKWTSQQKAAVFQSNVLHYSDRSCLFSSSTCPQPEPVIDIKVEAQAA